jgi:peptide chain release factor 1
LKNGYEIACTYRDAIASLNDAKTMLADSQDQDMIDLAKDELKLAEDAIPGLEDDLKIALLPQDPNDDKNVFIEIRPAAGGNESSLFSQELLRSYLMYAQSQ